MKTLTHLLILFSALLFSCHNLNHGNFNKQKYTRLKSAETEVRTTEIIPEKNINSNPGSNQKAPNENPIIYAEIVDDEGGAESEIKSYTTRESLEVKPFKKGFFPLNESVKPDQTVTHYEETESETKPSNGLITAWMIYLFLLIVSIVLVYLGITLEMELMLLVGIALWPILVIYGVILLKRIVQKKEKGESSLLKGMEISTRTIFISALCGFISSILLIIGAILLG